MYDGMALYRAVVASASSTTGEITVRIPAALGSKAVLPISTIGRSAVSPGVWNVPNVGDQVIVAVEDERFSNIFLVPISESGQLEGLTVSGNLSVTGNVTAANLVGSGTYLTNLNATNLTSGTVPVARLTGAYTGITGLGTLGSLSVTGTVTAGTFSGSGASLTSLPAAQLTGTINTARLSGAYTGITSVGTLTGLTVGTNALSFTGSNGVNWSAYGGSIWMQDTSWVRTDKGFYNGANTLANDGHLSIGYGGATDATYRARVNGSMNIANTLLVGGIVTATNYFMSTGAGAGFFPYDRDTTNRYVGLYMSSNIGRVHHSSYGDVITFNSDGQTAINDGKYLRFKGLSDANHSIRTLYSPSATPWCDGLELRGADGWSFYSSSQGTWKMGYRGAASYSWVDGGMLIGSSPDDNGFGGHAGYKLRVANGRVSIFYGLTSGYTWSEQQIRLESPGSNGQAGISFHTPSHGVAPILRCYGPFGERLDAINSANTGYVSLNASAFNVQSTAKSKEDIQDVMDADLLEKISALQVHRYRMRVRPQNTILSERFKKVNAAWTSKGKRQLEPQTHHWEYVDHDCSSEYCGGSPESPCVISRNDTHRYGLVAEELYEAGIVEAVELDNDGPAAIDVAQIAAMSIGGVAALTRKLEELTAKVHQLEQQL